jgi:hypothetical protein
MNVIMQHDLMDTCQVHIITSLKLAKYAEGHCAQLPSAQLPSMEKNSEDENISRCSELAESDMV